MKKQITPHRAEIVYFSGEKKVFEPISERQAKRLYDEAVRNMALAKIKRVSYGPIV